MYVYVCVHVHECVPWETSRGGQRTAFRNQVSPSTVWVPGTELRLLELVASTFIHYIISLAGNKILKHLQIEMDEKCYQKIAILLCH